MKSMNGSTTAARKVRGAPAGTTGSLTKSVIRIPGSMKQAVIAYNGRQPPVPLAALYLDPASMPMDYPFTVLPGAGVEKANAARAVLAVLSGDRYRKHLAEAGLRADDGSVGPDFATPKGAPQLTPIAPAAPDPSTIDTVLSTWTALTSPGRLLALGKSPTALVPPGKGAGLPVPK